MEQHDFNEQEFLEKVEQAARKGARSGRAVNSLLRAVPMIISLALLVLVVFKVDTIGRGFQNAFHFENGAADNDLVLSNSGIFGYTAANFEDAILGDSGKLKKIEVFEQEVSDVSTVIDTGFFQLGIFTKNQIITYNGTAVYTVDLSNLSSDDIRYDPESQIITLYIPHAEQEPINIPEERIQFGDTNRGLLAFGDVKMTAEQAAQVQAMAREKMEEKLKEDNTRETADRFAKLTVWEMYSPIIKSVSKNASLEIAFK